MVIATGNTIKRRPLVARWLLRASPAAGGLSAIGLVLALWQFLPDRFLPADIASRPSDIISELKVLLIEGKIYTHLWATTRQVVIGTVVGAGAGIATALALFLGPRAAERVGRPLVEIGYAVPKPVLISFFVLWLGIDDGAKVALVISFVYFILYYNVREGLENLSTHTPRSLRLHGANRFQLVRLFFLPALEEHIVSGLRLAIPLAYSAAVFADLNVSGRTGLGVLINRYFRNVDAAGVLAVVIVIGFIGGAIDIALAALLKRRGAAVRGALPK